MPLETRAETALWQRLEPKNNKRLSSFAFKCNLRPYTQAYAHRATKKSDYM